MTPNRFSFVYAALTASVLALGGAGLAPPQPASGQQLWSPMVPWGRLEISATPTFVSWDSRFGLRSNGVGTQGVTELLRDDLSDPSSRSLFPGVADLEERVQALTGNDGYRAYLGVSRARLTKSQTRVPLRAAFGVFDWLTVGVTVPLVKSRTELTYSFVGDSTSLGINPLVMDRAAVLAYVGQIESRFVAAAAQAAEACADAPGSPACASAQLLELTVFGYLATVEDLYNASSFFPTESSYAGQGLRSWALGMSDALEAAGLGNIAGLLPLAPAPVLDEDDINTVVTASEGGLQMGPLGTVPVLWALGDVEVDAWARLLSGERRDSAEAPVSMRYLVAGGALVRLGTGAVDDPAIVHDLGSGDGQTDVEGRIYAEVMRTRFGVSGEFRYGVQLSTTLPRRIAPPDVVLTSASSLTEVEWTPGNYLELEVAPRYRLTSELSFTGWYGLRSKAADQYRRVSAIVPGPGLDERFPGPLYSDASLLEAETEETVHRLGLSLIYSTMDAWSEGLTGSPFQAYLSLSTAVGGSGGQTSNAFTAQAGVRFFRRMLGG